MQDIKPQKTIIDCNNFWSKSGGGVRRFHLEKIKNFQAQNNFLYVFIMHDEKSYTEEVSPNTIIEHLYVPKVLGNWEYRFLFRPTPLITLFKKYRPDIVECGSPYILPWLIRFAIRKLEKKPLITAFWHADFPVTYVERIISKKNITLGKFLGNVAWKYAAITFKPFDAIFVSSKQIASRMNKMGLNNLCHLPLGINTQMFNASKKDESIIQKIKAGSNERLSLFFPHRFCEEKGLRTLLAAWPSVVAKLKVEPALIFASTGPDLAKVKNATQVYAHTQYIGYINDQEEMARWYASCDLGLILSGWETFSLSLLEAMSSGQILITANSGAAAEHMENAKAGLTIPTNNPKALAQAIITIAQDKENKYRGDSQNYAQLFTWHTCFDRQRKFYTLLLNNKTKGLSLTKPLTEIND